MPPCRTILLCLLLFLPTAPVAAQTEAIPTVESLREAIGRTKADASLDDAVKEAVGKRYEEAIAQIEAAAAFEQETAAAKAEIEKGPAEIAALRAEIESRRDGTIPEAAGESADPPADAAPESVETRLTSERARAAELARQVRDQESGLTASEGRPAANRERIVAVTRLLAEAEGVVSKGAGESAQAQAEFAWQQVRVRALRAELAALEQEALGFDIHGHLLLARRDLTASDLVLVRERVTRLESRQRALVAERIGETERLIGELDLPADADPGLRELVGGAREQALANQALLGRIAAAEAELAKANVDLDRLRREAENLRAQIGIGGFEESFAEIALELRRTLPTPQSLRGAAETRRREISTARLAAFREDRELDATPSSGGQAEELLDLLRAKGFEETVLSNLRPSLVAFLGNRTRLRQDSIDANRRLAALLGEIDLVASETLAAASELRDYLGERLVWVASSPPLGKKDFTGLGSAFLTLAGPGAMVEYGQAVARIGTGRWLLAALLALALLAPRPRLRRFLAASAARTRRISTDRVTNTLGALAASLWLALPAPAMLGFFGWVFASDPRAGGAAYALGKGLMAPAALLLLLRFASVLCWKDGIAEAHFRWRRPLLDPLHGGLLSLIFLYLPAHLLLAVWWHDGGNLAAFQGAGRLVFIAAMVSLAFVLRAFLQRGGDALLTDAPRAHPFHRLRRVWMAAALLFPLALAVLAASGHFLSAVTLAYLMQKTVFVVFGGVLLYAFLTRWASLKARRLALADALAQRETRRAAQREVSDESAASESEAPPVPEETAPVEEEEPVDWAQVGEQTRYLIRAVVALLVLIGCWVAWSEALPALKYLDSRQIVGQVGLGDLVRLGVLSIVVGIVFQNLPGLLELGFLRALDLEPGVRNAVVTICRYAVVAVAAALAFQILGLDWSRFGWIAAALSVGLGFGLQEVVANFVSGLIVLFERPIRVGDIVTVGGVDGTVTKIRIRATTITTGDKKEFIVPNKEFITGKILNWTLSSPVTRLVFPVGVTYGSDVRKAGDILLDIARSQPEILADPAPAAVLEQFGTSTLNLSLRCFVARPEHRLELTHRIHSLIYERFTAAGVEMASRYQEVHVKSLDAPARGEGEGE